MTIKKDIKYIIKRIIIGVGIVLLLALLRSSTGFGFILDVEAQEINATPNDILISTTGGISTYSPTTNTWGGQTVFALPSNISYDWPSGSSIYFRYPQFNGYSQCSQYSNKATWSYRLYNASTSSFSVPNVSYEDVTSGGYHRCSVEKYSNYLDVICNNVTINHSLNIQIAGVPNGRWGITQIMDIQCIQSGADISGSINAQANQNTQNIINNNNQNTQNIINNNNENTDKIIESQIVCKNSNDYNLQFKNSRLGNNGIVTDDTNFGITSYISITKDSKIVAVNVINTSSYLCFYNSNREVISCIQEGILSTNQVLTIPNEANYVRFTVRKSNLKPNFKICNLSNQFLTDYMTDTDISQSKDDFDAFIRESNPTTHGLSDIVVAPLRLIQSITSSSCSSLSIPLPFVNQSATLPCMVPIYQTYFGNWFTLYQTITTGVIAYWVGINFFRIIKNMLNPTDDKVEVFNL